VATRIASTVVRPVETALKAMAVNKSAFTKADLEAYRMPLPNAVPLTAMLNYYRNVWQQRLLSFDWSVLEVPTLMIWERMSAW